MLVYYDPSTFRYANEAKPYVRMATLAPSAKPRVASFANDARLFLVYPRYRVGHFGPLREHSERTVRPEGIASVAKRQGPTFVASRLGE